MALHFKEYKQRFSGDIHFYGNASHAFYEILVWLQVHRPKSKPNVILPVFIPAKLYRVVLAAGYTPKFCDISLGCEMDVNRIRDLIDDQTQAVFCVHYFGMPAPVHDLKSLTGCNDIFLIEDCAHTLNSRWQGEELGTVGDCAIFSGRKMLQLPAGGFLVLNKQPWKFEPDYKKRVRSIFTACKFSQSRLKYLYYRLTRGYDPLNLAWAPRVGHINFSEKHRIKVQEISRLNKAYTHFIDLEQMVNRRRENFEYVLNGIKDLSNVEPLIRINKNKELLYEKNGKYHLHEGVTPYSLPVLAPLGSRETFRKRLRDQGIGCGAGWPESPFGLKNFEQTVILSRRMLEIPVHQGMSTFQLRRIVECFKAFENTEAVKRKKTVNFNTDKRQGQHNVYNHG